MRVATVAAVAVALVCSASAAPFSSDEEILAHARAHFNELPEPVQRDLTIENLRKWLTVDRVEVSRPHDGVADGEQIDPAIIWRIGKDVWNIIQDNVRIARPHGRCARPGAAGKCAYPCSAPWLGRGSPQTPVVNATIDYGGAVPKGVKDWTQLSGWKDQQTQLYTFKFKNFAGMLLTEYQWCAPRRWWRWWNHPSNPTPPSPSAAGCSPGSTEAPTRTRASTSPRAAP